MSAERELVAQVLDERHMPVLLVADPDGDVSDHVPVLTEHLQWEEWPIWVIEGTDDGSVLFAVDAAARDLRASLDAFLPSYPAGAALRLDVIDEDGSLVPPVPAAAPVIQREVAEEL